uniref:Uncharacterized protein n=1 Tax=Philodina roseola TaxID=96448 RepID=B2L3L8_PHIRO|nr:unknown [Philodina roseola]
MNLVNSENQLLISFLNCPRLIYVNAALAQLKCAELKLQNTPSGIPIDFFRDAISIGHLIIHNPSFSGFLSSSTRSASVHFELHQLSIRDISVRHLKGKHFPISFSSLKTLTLENFVHSNGFRSWNSHDLAERFPQLTTLKIFSCSIQRLSSRVFEHFERLEYLTLDGIQIVENDAFFNLYQLKQLDLGKNIRRLDPYAFLHMNSDVFLLLNQSLQYRLDDEKDFCTFAQFSSTKQSKSFVRFPSFFNNFCSCTIRYVYRHIDKSLVSLTPSCYGNASVYILTQEERICYFEQRLLQCDILPNGGITIYGQHYNVSYFYTKQMSKGHKRFAIFFQYRIYYLFAIGFFLLALLLLFYQQRQRQKRTCRHLNRLLKRANLSTENNGNLDIIYQSADEQINLNTTGFDRSTKV